MVGEWNGASVVRSEAYPTRSIWGTLVVLYGRNNDSDSACGLVLIIVSARTRLLGAPYITRTITCRMMTTSALGCQLA